MNFKQFFYEQISFKSLPGRCPYGFWISVDDIIPVSTEGHVSTAIKYLGKNRDISQGSIYIQMYKKGFVRVVADKFNWVMYIQSSKSLPNISARKVAKDVGIFYGLTPVVENDKLFESFSNIDLPQSPPYGFWIKYNEIIPVRGGPGSHWNVGKSYLLNKKIDTSYVHDHMFKIGFTRCVFDVIDVDGSMYIEYKPGLTPRESIKKSEDVAEYYNTIPYIQVVKD